MAPPTPTSVPTWPWRGSWGEVPVGAVSIPRLVGDRSLSAACPVGARHCRALAPQARVPCGARGRRRAQRVVSLVETPRRGVSTDAYVSTLPIRQSVTYVLTAYSLPCPLYFSCVFSAPMLFTCVRQPVCPVTTKKSCWFSCRVPCTSQDQLAFGSRPLKASSRPRRAAAITMGRSR